MLKPAILYKDIIEEKFAEQLYSDDFFYYSGYGACNSLPEIKAEDNRYQWAIVSEGTDEVIGYFAYYIDYGTDTVSNFGLYSFKRTGFLIGRDVLNKMEELIKEHRRIEWRMIGGNPVKRSYDKLCEMYHGNCVHLHDVTQDAHGGWHDEYIYEIVHKKEKS